MFSCMKTHEKDTLNFLLSWLEQHSFVLERPGLIYGTISSLCGSLEELNVGLERIIVSDLSDVLH